MKKRVLSLLLALMMIVSLVPTAAMAYSDTDVAYAVTGGNIYFNESTGTITDCNYSVTEAIIPSEINGVAVTSIGARAFSRCSSLTTITLPDSVTSIGDEAFDCCSSLASITIPNSVTSIGDSVFWYCVSLTSVEIPNSVTSIGRCAFFHCDKLSNVTIPDSVTSIGDRAFAACSSIIDISIPDNVTHIDSEAFLSCSSLTNISVSDSNSTYSSVAGVLFNKAKTTIIAYPPGKNDDTYVIPDTVVSLDDYAFDACSNLENIVIPDGITSIGFRTFYDCSSLTSVVIPKGVSSIGDYAFYGCSSLESINVAEDNSNYSSIDGVLFDKNQTTLIKCPSGKDCDKYVVPESVTSIRYDAFRDCSSLESITIPDGVTSIGFDAFRDCSSLASIEIPDGITSIKSETFYGCSSLESVTIPNSVNRIDAGAFKNCSSLTSIEIPDGVTKIEYEAFYSCSSLESVKIPDGVTEIWDMTFYGCSSLTSIEIPDGVTSIEVTAFDGCSSLESINVAEDNSNYSSVDGVLFDKSLTTLIRCPSDKDCDKYVVPESVTSIRYDAFRDCSHLESIAIPDNVTSIGFGAFEGCGSLENITIPDGVTSIEGYTFDGCSSLATITIPDSVTSIGYYAFKDCNHLTDVYYTGDETQWKEISIDLESNFCLENATIHFNYVPHKHSYTSTVTAPTCTAKGYTTYTCSCGDSYIDSETDALGHSYGEWTQTKAPTCTAAGTEIRTCSRCNATESKTVEALSHAIVHHDAKAATCTEIGWNAYDTCKNCDYTTYSEISATGHHHNAVVTAPTCTEKGYTTYTCSCGDSYVDNYTNALGHNYSNGSCTRCGAADPDYKSPTAVTFSDVAAKAYYANAVQWAVENKITKGTDDTHFSPDQGCTRGQVVTFLWRAAGSPKVSGNAGFVDVKSTDYYYDAVKWAVANGITTGTDATHFSPNATCTRGQVVTFMYRAEGSPATSGSCGFVDVKSADYYYNAVIWAVANEITNGTDATHFSPSATCTRAQVVTFLYRNAQK